MVRLNAEDIPKYPPEVQGRIMAIVGGGPRGGCSSGWKLTIELDGDPRGDTFLWLMKAHNTLMAVKIAPGADAED